MEHGKLLEDVIRLFDSTFIIIFSKACLVSIIR